MAIFVEASPAEILRAVQKDDIVRSHIHSGLSDIIFKTLGSQIYLQYHDYVPVFGHFLYAITTTLSGSQTLGEEYTSIVQVISGLKEIPSLARRIFMIILNASGSIFTTAALKYLKQSLNKNENIRSEAKKSVLEVLDILQNILPFILLSHKALFYFTGTFYDLSKRLTGVHFISVRHWLRENQPLYGFKILGFAAVLHLLLRVVYDTRQWWLTRQKLKVAESTSLEDTYKVIKHKCPLCLDNLKQPSSTLCGHLFCWSCVMDWLQTDHRCPVCRVNISSSRIIPLRN